MNNNYGSIFENLQEVFKTYQQVLGYISKHSEVFQVMKFVDLDVVSKTVTKAIEYAITKPNKLIEFQMNYLKKMSELTQYNLETITNQSHEKALYTPDKRFTDLQWTESMFFHSIQQFYLMMSEYFEAGLNALDIPYQDKAYAMFVLKQITNAFSPTNFVFSNPKVLQESIETNFRNLVNGMQNFYNDLSRNSTLWQVSTTDQHSFKLGENLATTEGKVIYQNDLMQLIHYKPQSQAYSVPVLIVPPWINKYYILDLSPTNSFVKWLTENNFQVFMISWVNPNEKHANTNFEDYMYSGMIEAIDYLKNTLKYPGVNCIGYCIGGTLLGCGLAYLAAKKQNDFVKSATFFTTLLDFTNIGEAGIFVREESIKLIEEDMKKKGYFDGRYLALTFSALRSNDLIWSFFVNNYLLGKRPLAFDILYWNGDSTNLAASMYSFYLRKMCMENLLVKPGAISMKNTPLDLTKIKLPTFFLAAKSDHIVPWKSSYQGMQHLTGGDKTFCLTASGHIAGVINHPDQHKYAYWTNKDLSLNADDWFATSKENKESWWPCWFDWVKKFSGETIKKTPYQTMKEIEKAPGSYVKKILS